MKALAFCLCLVTSSQNIRWASVFPSTRILSEVIEIKNLSFYFFLMGIISETRHYTYRDVSKVYTLCVLKEDLKSGMICNRFYKICT